MKVIRRNDPQHLATPRTTPSRDQFFFYEKNTGVAHFHIEAAPDGSFPIDQAAGLLAMHCMVRGQCPGDYVVMVEAEPSCIEGLAEKAEKLLQAGHSAGTSVRLTRREEEVLGGVIRSLANKEIAASLNLSERTVKFHVSSLLAKFRVRGRMELVREASRQTGASLLAAPSASTREPHPFSQHSRGMNSATRSAEVVPLQRRPMMA